MTDSLNPFSAMPQNSDLKIPPPVFVTMEGEFIGFSVEERWCRNRFPVLEKFENPIGIMQGGIVAAAIDNTAGPLSYMVAPPSVTKTMTVTYKRPVKPDYEYIEVLAKVESLEGREITLSAEVYDPNGKILATATMLQIIVSRPE